MLLICKQIASEGYLVVIANVSELGGFGVKSATGVMVAYLGVTRGLLERTR